jgi:molybdenum cofactor cytidylyltransferase
MQFGPILLNDAVGKLVAHNITGPDGVRLLHKGKVLGAADIEVLRAHGLSHVYTAWLDPGDIDENTAALRTASLICGDLIEVSRAAAGRVNLKASAPGVLRVDVARLTALNECDGITVATIPSNTLVAPHKTIAIVKIIPFAVPESDLQVVASLASTGGPLLHIDVLEAHTVGLILYGSPALRDKLAADFGPLTDRVTALGSEIYRSDFIDMGNPHIEEALAEALGQMRRVGVKLILLAGETAVMHHNDMIPRAIEQCSGTIESVGVPVDPGNLMMLAYLGDVPVLSAPGCARSAKPNVVDHVIPRLLVGEHLTRADIIALAHGGLLAG